jgi:hypothetical protein
MARKFRSVLSIILARGLACRMDSVEILAAEHPAPQCDDLIVSPVMDRHVRNDS